jgi:hypothetical protein
MPRYLVEVSQPTRIAAKRVKNSIRTIGSHFATRARWQQRNGTATGTLVVEADDRRWALGIVPPSLRPSAQVYQLYGRANGPVAPAVADGEAQLHPIAA